MHAASTNCNVWWMECSSLHSDWYQKVWPRLDAADAWQSPLAWRAWARQVQSHHLDSSLPYRYRTDLAADCVPVSEMAQRRHLRSAAGHQLVLPSELMWPSGVLCTRSETVKLFCLDCCVTLATTLPALDILWRHFLFSEYKCIQCITGFGDYALYSLF